MNPRCDASAKAKPISVTSSARRSRWRRPIDATGSSARGCVQATPTYDGHTLNATLEQVEQITGVPITDGYVDKGDRGHDYTGDATIHIAGSGTKRLTTTKRKRRKRRSAVEPKIGHAKHENLTARCTLKGLEGDAMNVLLAAAGANLTKLLRLLP